MDLSEPKTGLCLLCYPFEEHTVEYALNQNERPKFYCEKQKTPVNLRGDESSASHTRDELAAQAVELHQQESAELEEPEDDDDSDDGTSLADILDGGDE